MYADHAPRAQDLLHPTGWLDTTNLAWGPSHEIALNRGRKRGIQYSQTPPRSARQMCMCAALESGGRRSRMLAGLQKESTMEILLSSPRDQVPWPDCFGQIGFARDIRRGMASGLELGRCHSLDMRTVAVLVQCCGSVDNGVFTCHTALQDAPATLDVVLHHINIPSLLHDRSEPEPMDPDPGSVTGRPSTSFPRLTTHPSSASSISLCGPVRMLFLSRLLNRSALKHLHAAFYCHFVRRATQH